MTALQETAKQIAQLESDMAKQRNALREIRSRVDRALAEPERDVYADYRALILRPAKRIVFVEDPNGDFWEGAAGSMIMGTCPGATRYRREGTP